MPRQNTRVSGAPGDDAMSFIVELLKEEHARETTADASAPDDDERAEFLGILLNPATNDKELAQLIRDAIPD